MRIARGTWLATLLIVCGLAGVAMLVGMTTITALLLVSPALVITPVVWWVFVARDGPLTPGRGAAAGAIIAPVIWVLFVALGHVAWLARRALATSRQDAWFGFGVWLEIVLAVIGGMCAVLCGAACGAVVAIVERRLRAVFGAMAKARA